MAEQQQSRKSCRDCGLKISYNIKDHCWEDFGTFNKHWCKSFKSRPSPMAAADIGKQLEKQGNSIQELLLKVTSQMMTSIDI